MRTGRGARLAAANGSNGRNGGRSDEAAEECIIQSHNGVLGVCVLSSGRIIDLSSSLASFPYIITRAKPPLKFPLQQNTLHHQRPTSPTPVSHARQSRVHPPHTMASVPPPDLDPTTSFTPFQDAVFSDVMSAVKSASALASNDLDFHRSSDPTFAAALDATQKRILDLTYALLKSAADGSDIAAPRLTSEDDVDDKWPAVVDVADFLLERADTCLDEYTGAIKQKHPEPLPGAAKQMSGRQRKSQNFKAHSYANRTMAKPQLQFEIKPDNMDIGPFKPLLTVKPHAIVPLEESLKLVPGEDGKEHYDHPYRAEIEGMEYPKEMFEVKEPEMYKPFEETEAVYVDDAQGLVAMLGELKQATVIAVDLEHHDSRSYVGFVCLMQISTREKDWIVDTLKLRSELQILNEVFADPKIIKVCGMRRGKERDVMADGLNRFYTERLWISFGYSAISDSMLWGCSIHTLQQRRWVSRAMAWLSC